MTSISIPTFRHKSDVYSAQEGMLSYLPRVDMHFASFKTEEFLNEEKKHGILPETSIRNTTVTMPGATIPAIPGLEFKIGTCIFSENKLDLGLAKHIHLPKTTLPTITVGKKIYSGNDGVMFNFHRRNAPPSINLTEDFVLRFDSSALPHEIIVPDDTQSIWLFIVMEHCSDIDLEDVRKFYDCKVIYDYYG